MNTTTHTSRSIIDALLRGKSEEECLMYPILFQQNGCYNTYEEIHYLSWKYGYERLRSKLELVLPKEEQLSYSIRNAVYQSYFHGTPFPSSFEYEYEYVCYSIEQFLFNPHITSISEYAKLVAITLVSSSAIADFVRGLEAFTYNEEDADYYYIAGYFLGLHLPANELRLLVSAHVPAVVFLPCLREHYRFINPKVSHLLTREDIPHLPNYLVSTYRPDLLLSS